MSLRPTGSYATGKVRVNERIGGGLVGLDSVGTIRASYATGEVSGNINVGGLVGVQIVGSSIHDSYFDSDTFGSTGTEGRTTKQLQMPTTYTGIYANWNVDVDNADTDDNPLTGGDDPWDFGTSTQYPILQVDFNGDGFKSWEEFGPHSRRVAVSTGTLSLMEGEMRTYTVVLLTMPENSVTVTPVSDNPAVSAGALIFMPENWNTAQTVTVHAVDDGNTVSEMVSLTHAVTSDDPNYDSATVRDVMVNVTDNGAGIVVSSEGLSLMEGEAGSYTVVLLSAPTATVTVTPISNTPAAVSVVSSVTTFTLTFTDSNWNTPLTVMVSAEEDDNVVGGEVPLRHAVDSDDPNYASAVSPDVTVDVTDNDTPVFVSTGTLSLTEGTTGSYTVVLLGRPTTPSVTVTPVVTAVSGNTTSVRVSGPLTFTDSNWGIEQTVMVEAVEDINTASEVVRVTHTVSASPNFGPVPAPVVTVSVTDDDGGMGGGGIGVDDDGIRVRVRVFLEGPLR